MPRWSVNVKALKGTQARTTKGPEILNSLESHGTLWELDESRGLPSKNITHKHGVPMQGLHRFLEALHSWWRRNAWSLGQYPQNSTVNPWGWNWASFHHCTPCIQEILKMLAEKSMSKRSSKCLLRNQWATDWILFFFHKRDLEPRDIKGLDQDHSES
jgi:hypothetical protein